MITISTKELRNNFSTVLEKLSKGENFLLIHRSRPVAEIKKPENVFSFQEATDKDIEISSIKDTGKDFLSKEELDYYLSLK